MIQSVFFFLLFTLVKILGVCCLCVFLVALQHFLQTIILEKPKTKPSPKPKKKKETDKLKKIANRLGGELLRFDDSAIINFQKNEIAYVLEIRQKRTATFVTLHHKTWPSQDYALRIDCRKHGAKLPIHSTQSLIPLKHSILDEDFIVESNSLELTNLVVDNGVARLIQFHLQHAHNRFSLRISGSQFTLAGMASRILANQQILALTRSFIKIHQSMLENYVSKVVKNEGFAETPIAIDADVQMTDDATCTVCGETIIKSYRTCNKCRTRYHKDCWEYVGKCSTYGCHSRKWSTD